MEVLYQRCCGLDVHKETVVACLRVVSGGEVVSEVRTFETTTASLIALSEWLAENGCTHVAMEATGVYWKPVWHILDDGDFQLILANAAHVKNVPGRKTDVNDAIGAVSETCAGRRAEICAPPRQRGYWMVPHLEHERGLALGFVATVPRSLR
jgi:transposase